MNINAEKHFMLAPTIEAPRSIFDRSHEVLGTCNVGDMVPVECWQDVMPGDTIDMSTSVLTRFSSPLKNPTMDNAFLDYYYFFVPNRLLFHNWEKLMGANDDPWTQTTVHQVPQITIPTGGFLKGTIAEKLGVPIGRAGTNISALPFRAVAKIYNDYFRDENNQYALNIDFDETTRTGSNGSTYLTDVQLGGMCPKVNKFHDYFTSCLPSPVRGPNVTLPLGSTAPVVGTGKSLGLRGMWTDGTVYEYQMAAGKPDGGSGTYNSWLGTSSGNITDVGTTSSFVSIKTNSSVGVSTRAANSGLITDLSNATAATINQLYQAFALNKMYVLDGLSGTRYNELIYSHFKVKSPDARLQRAEYLGGKRVALNIHQVEQTSENTSTSFIGELGGYSATGDFDKSFTYSAQEFGQLVCIMCVRTEHKYQQGLERAWSRKLREEHYFPVLANISEQGVKNKEIFLSGTASTDEAIFGYQEAWADYRYKPSRISGQFRSGVTGSLDKWTYADDYATTPVLSATWLAEPTTNFDRTVQVTSSNVDQVMYDFYFKNPWTREMPMYSIPSLPA